MKTITLPPELTTKTQGGLYVLPISDDCPDEFVLTMLLHGYHQKMVDVWTSCAKKKLPDGSKRDATDAERSTAANAVHDRLKSYVWNKRTTETEKLDFEESALRALLKEKFVKSGLGKTQAGKDSADSKSRFAIFRDVVIKPQLVPETIGRLDEIAEKNFKLLVDSAKKTAQIMAEAADRAAREAEEAGGYDLD